MRQKKFESEFVQLKAILKDDHDVKVADLVFKQDDTRRRRYNWLSTMLSIAVPAFVLILLNYSQNEAAQVSKKKEFESDMILKFFDMDDISKSIRNFQSAKRLGLITDKDLIKQVDWYIQDTVNQKRMFEFENPTYLSVGNGISVYSELGSTHDIKLLSSASDTIPGSGFYILIADSSKLGVNPFINQ